MPGALAHSQSEVIRKALVNLSLGTDANLSPLQAWPVYANGEPDTPDSAITVYDSAGRDGGREMINGERQEFHGFQVRVRAAARNTGYAKARAIAVAMDESVYQNSVVIGANTYLLHSIFRTSDVLDIGRERPTSERRIFTINGLAMIRQTV